MFKIHIARDRQPLGEFTPQEVAEGLKSGKFLPTDLVWREPMDKWMALGDWNGLPVNLLEETPPAAPASDRPSSELSPLAESVTVSAPVVTSIPQPAWERRAELGILPAIIETIRQVYSAPVKTFQEMTTEGGYKAPLLFYVIVSTISSWMAMIYQIAAVMVNPEAVMGAFAKNITPNFMIGSQVVFMVLTPLLLLVAAFIASGVFHAALQAFGVAKKNYEATFRIFCYASGAASVLQIVPLCGGTIFLAVQVLFLVLAVREVHRTETWRAVAGILTPTLMCCGLFIGGYALILSAATAQMLK